MTIKVDTSMPGSYSATAKTLFKQYIHESINKYIDGKQLLGYTIEATASLDTFHWYREDKALLPSLSQ